MPWFKVDDNLPFHAKVVAAGNPAMGLWVRAGAWSSQQLSEGFIPDHIVKTMGTRGEIARLVSVRLWEKLDGGYQFWQWAEDGRQPTREQVEADRKASRERQKRARERAKSQRESRRDDSVTNGVSHEAVTPAVTVPPTRPDPTRPLSTSTSVSSIGGSSVTRDSQTHPPLNCSKHPSGTLDPCGACGAAKRTRAEWDTEQTRLDKARAVDERRAENEARWQAIRHCRLCDDDGRRNGGVCDHIQRQAGALARAKASIKETA
jgi:hypothetical protein